MHGRERRHRAGSGGFGPDGLPGALVLTFDNLGEASELARGTWSPDAAPRRHRSVTDVLPRLLDELDRHELVATFFVEAINCELYPDELLEIARRGHELGMHGWCHEPWAELSVEREREALGRARRAFATLGIGVRGFRPPGGWLTPTSPRLMYDAGIRWCSPAGVAPGLRDGLVYVPFEWPLVDAYHLMERFGDLRVERGEPATPRECGALSAQLSRELEELPARGRQRTLTLHPFLMLDEAWFFAVRELLSRISALALQRHAWVVSGGRFAEWLRAAPGAPAPSLDHR